MRASKRCFGKLGAKPWHFAIATLAACGGSSPPVQSGPPPRPQEPLSELQALNAKAKKSAATHTLFGERVPDPFYALESDSPLTREWIRWQSARTKKAIASWEKPGMREKLRLFLGIGSIQAPIVRGGKLFYLKREGDREQPALFVRLLAGGRRSRGSSPEERILVDPLEAGERATIDWFFPSPNGRFVAYGISANGDERSTLRIIEVDTGRVLDETIPHTKWCLVSWLHSEDGFYYRRYPKEGEPGFEAAHPDTYHARLFFHRLGTSPDEDTLVFSPDDRTHFPSAFLSEDDRYLVIHVRRGWTQTDVLLLDRGARPQNRILAPDESHPLIPIRSGKEYLYEPAIYGGFLYLLTNEDAPKYHLLRASLAELVRQGENAPMSEIVPEGEAKIEDFALLGDRVATSEIIDVSGRIRLFRTDGRLIGEVALPPGRGELAGFSGDPRSGHLVFVYSNYVTPPTLYWVQPRTLFAQSVVQVNSPIDLTAYEMSFVQVASRDGTMIPLTLIHRAGESPTGQAFVLIYGYGGFNIPLMPTFVRHALYWLERGGVYAVANLRGGGEFGESWHRAGSLENKERVFEDMEAVIRWIGGEGGWSKAERIAIMGGSNGGLLVGAMITRIPDRFRAAVAYVGLYDMVRYHLFPPAHIWVTEYGNPEKEQEFRWLYAYSPYHRVRDKQPMPYVLIETGENDTRVFWGHSTKFAARLQDATGAADPPVWFYREEAVGHGAGTPLSALVERYVRMYAFIEHALGMEAP
ncbi:MAG: prolyl oligopeptidase family serine peptidase [Sandaracinaceae bacterium]|nr:prolyl oligopeptidase family serine peptidase [Sandaracinaceae bacterium]